MVVPELTNSHCGAARPGHFDGVTTIVNKLFNIVQADLAVFGQKDFQQLAVIKKMTRDLYIPIEIIAAPTARDSDGLALSSRNQYLNQSQRAIAPKLHEIVQSCQQALQQASPKQLSTDTRLLSSEQEKARQALDQAGFSVDYFNIVDAHTLGNLNKHSQEAVILVAAFLGNTRLIDNSYFPL